MKIGQLSQQSGVSVDTIRYYERRGLIPAATRTASGYRHYSERDISRLQFIVHSKDLGFTLEEIAQLLALRSNGRNCADIRAVAKAKAAEIATRITQLARMQEVLENLADQCANKTDSDPCPILKSLEKHP